MVPRETPGRKPSKLLFKEYNPEGIYSLEEWRSVFLMTADVTEYKAAITLVEDWREWNRIKSNWKEFNEIVAEWVAEVEVAIRSKAITALVLSGDPQSNKWVAEGRYKDKPTAAKAKLKDKEIAKAALSMAEDEIARVTGFVVLDGGAESKTA